MNCNRQKLFKRENRAGSKWQEEYTIIVRVNSLIVGMKIIIFQITILLLRSIKSSEIIKERCPAYSFFHDYGAGKILSDDDLKLRLDHFKMLGIWLRNWYSNGWNPTILDLSHSKSHQNFTTLKERVEKYPTQNNLDHELTGYLKWLGFDQQGGGTFVEFDVMNFGAQEIPSVLQKCGAAGDLTTFAAEIPALVFGDQKSIQRIVKALFNYNVTSRDQFRERPHISSWDIIRNEKANLFHYIFPDPPRLAHFKHEQKAKIFFLEVMLMDRSEWINFNLQTAFTRKHLVRLFQPNKVAQPSLDSILRPLKGCPLKHVQMNVLMLPSLRSAKDEKFACTFIETDDLEEELVFDNRLDLVFFEPVIERAIRPYANSSVLRRYGDNPKDIMAFLLRSPENLMVRKMAPMEESIEMCLSVAKEKLLNDQVFIGMLDDIEASKLLLEYQVGFMLPNIKESYTPPSVMHNLEIPDDLRKAILDFHWADHELYQFAKDIFNERLNQVKAVDQQLDRYKKEIPMNVYQEAMHV